MRKYNSLQNRRGVTLMLVLGLMTMFAMLIIGFMVITTQARRTAQNMANFLLSEKNGTASGSNEAGARLQAAVDVLLSGNLDTVIGPHSILENLYGHPNYYNTSNTEGKFLEGTINNVVTDTTTGLVRIQATMVSDAVTNSDAVTGTSYGTADLIGSVLTVQKPGGKHPDPRIEALREKLNLQSFQIVRVLGVNQFQIAPPENWTAAELSVLPTVLTNCTLTINTPAFSGTGPGFNPDVTDVSQAALTGTDEGINAADGSINFPTTAAGKPLVLRPNVLAPEANGTQPYQNYLKHNRVLMNPDYTAPDYRSMFLAWNDIEYDASAGGWKINNTIPSFHRPQLVKYWNQGSTNPDADDIRKYTLRPLPQDHPDFTGSNPAAASTSPADEIAFLEQGPWDVDNDGNGIPDGIWLDIGLPTINENNQTYKPLVSYYVLDMDGRLNVNVHSNVVHDGNFDTEVGDALAGSDYGGTKYRGTSSGAASVRLDLGLSIAKDNTGASDTVTLGKLFQGDPAVTPPLDGRYRNKTEPGDYTQTGTDLTKLIGEINGVNIDAFGNHCYDFWGNFATAFDPLGNQFFKPEDIGNLAKNPYLFNPYQANGIDAPFNANDLQLLLRSFGDIDYAVLSPRLRTLLSESDLATTFSGYQQHLTTRSSGIPAPSRLSMPGSATGGLFSRVAAIVEDANVSGVDKEKITDKILGFLPEEIFTGRGIDVNKFSLPPYINYPDDAEGTAKEKLLRDKVRFARGLFYLVMILRYEQLKETTYAEGNLTRDEAVKRVAQWAVNVIDFTDDDAIMTPLVYSKNPFVSIINDEGDTDYPNSAVDKFFKGKEVPNSTTTDYGLVWGMENPEVAITETFAVHNRRVADTAKESTTGGIACTDTNCHIKKERVLPNGSACTRPSDHDTDFDQVLIPEGSLFVELYYKGNPQRTTPAIDFTAGPTDISGKKTPVWRLLIGRKGSDTVSTSWTAAASRAHDALAQAESDTTGTYSFQPKKQFPARDIVNPDGCDIEPERIVWFGTEGTSSQQITNTTDGFPARLEREPYSFYARCTKEDEEPILLEPNSYMLIAPRMFTSFKSKPVDGTTVTQYGVPDGDSGTYINLRDLTNSSSPFEIQGWNSVKHKQPTILIAGQRMNILSPSTSNMMPWLTSDNIILGKICQSSLGDILQWGVGLNVSEPFAVKDGYVPPYASSSPPYPNYYPYYAQPTVSMSNELKSALGTTLPVNNGYTGEDLKSPKDTTDELKAYGTIPCYKTIMLQRLADPTRVWNPVNNPYITVDWNMIDLHVINSEKDTQGTDPATENGVKQGELYFTSRQWGHTAELAKNRPNLWARHIKGSPGGYAGLDDQFGTALANAGDDKFKELTLGYLNRNLTATATVPADLTDKATIYKGIPDGKAFMHFPWYDAPLNNSFELMLVPSVSPGRFGVEFVDSQTEKLSNIATSLGGRSAKFRDPVSEIGMYFNYFYNPTDSTMPPSLHLSELFEYIRVPSKFAGSVKWTKDNNTPPVPLFPYYTMQEPGKINLNTATAAAWAGLQGNTKTPNFPAYDALVKKRTDSKDLTNGGTFVPPSEFGTPFRAPGAANLVPPISVSGTTDTNALVRSATETGLFGSYTNASTSVTVPFIEPADTEFGNPFANLQNVLQLADVTETRSNVFAVWVTIGYFRAIEVADRDALVALYPALAYPALSGNIADDDKFKAVYPAGKDGRRYVLGNERGTDGNGSVKRNRAFYLIDRSIPVGFRRGETLNSRNVIVSKTVLE